jgi:glycosyltransferase involved in cell wall biosynthesis
MLPGGHRTDSKGIAVNHKIKVLQITANLGIGGLERVVVNLTRGLDPEKYEVVVCCLKFKGKFAKELEKCGIKVHLIPQKEKGTDYFAFWKLKDVIRQEKPVIVHTHNSNSLVDGVIASILTRVPVVIHTDHARKFPDTRRTMIAERILSLYINKIIAVSEETKNNLIKYEHIPANKIAIINNGIDGSKYDIAINPEVKIKELGLEKFKHIVGLGVRLTVQKGITHLVSAVPDVLNKFPDTAFVIAGSGYLLEELKEQATKLHVEENVFFIGPRLDMPEILQILDVYVLPSEWEGLPLVLLEAMAAKKAIVATNVGAVSKAIEHEQCGYLVAPKNPREISNKIISLLSSAKLRNEFANNAYNKFLNHFDIQHMIDGYMQIYEEELSRIGIKL